MDSSQKHNVNQRKTSCQTIQQDSIEINFKDIKIRFHTICGCINIYAGREKNELGYTPKHDSLLWASNVGRMGSGRGM